MAQPSFDFSGALTSGDTPHGHDARGRSVIAVSSSGPRLRELPPINGTTPKSRHASYTGAVHALHARSANLVALRQLWREPRTLNEISVLSGLPVSSVCSLKAALDAELEIVDFETVEWGEGRRPTKRCRWRLKT